MKISAVVITYNEEQNIERCLNSLKECVDELLVVDSYSTDRTREIAEALGARFVQNPFEGHIEQKNFAMKEASHDWVLSLDADEALSKDLQSSIRKVKESGDFDGYELNRLTSYCGKWIRHGGWYPDRKVRLWNRNRGAWGGENPHDRVHMKMGAKVGKLKGDLLHYSFYTIEDHIQQIQKFTTIAAQVGFQNGKKSGFLKRNLGPLFTFLKMYFFKLGLLDGYYGFVIAINSAHYKFQKETKLRELNKK